VKNTSPPPQKLAGIRQPLYILERLTDSHSEQMVITEFEGESVNSAEELAEAARDAREKSSMKVKVNRGSSSKTIEVKIPKKLKTSNL